MREIWFNITKFLSSVTVKGQLSLGDKNDFDYSSKFQSNPQIGKVSCHTEFYFLILLYLTGKN